MSITSAFNGKKLSLIHKKYITKQETSDDLLDNQTIVSIITENNTISSSELIQKQDEFNIKTCTNKKIPFSVPLFEDPRIMTRKELVWKLTQRGLDSMGSKELLVVRLLKAIVDKGLESSIDPNDMDDRQPEKWIHIGNLGLKEACEIEPDPNARIECMERVNKHLVRLTTNRNALVAAALGASTVTGESVLFHPLMRMGAAVMLEPIVQAELENMCGIQARIKESIVIFSLSTGFMGIPEHLTEEAVLKEEELAKKKKN